MTISLITPQDQLTVDQRIFEDSSETSENLQETSTESEPLQDGSTRIINALKTAFRSHALKTAHQYRLPKHFEDFTQEIQAARSNFLKKEDKTIKKYIIKIKKIDFIKKINSIPIMLNMSKYSRKNIILDENIEDLESRIELTKLLSKKREKIESKLIKSSNEVVNELRNYLNSEVTEHIEEIHKNISNMNTCLDEISKHAKNLPDALNGRRSIKELFEKIHELSKELNILNNQMLAENTKLRTLAENSIQAKSIQKKEGRHVIKDLTAQKKCLDKVTKKCHAMTTQINAINRETTNENGGIHKKLQIQSEPKLDSMRSFSKRFLRKLLYNPVRKYHNFRAEKEKKAIASKFDHQVSNTHHKLSSALNEITTTQESLKTRFPSSDFQISGVINPLEKYLQISRSRTTLYSKVDQIEHAINEYELSPDPIFNRIKELETTISNNPQQTQSTHNLLFSNIEEGESRMKDALLPS